MKKKNKLKDLLFKYLMCVIAVALMFGIMIFIFMLGIFLAKVFGLFGFLMTMILTCGGILCLTLD